MGTIDLLLELPEGEDRVVIIDHKTGFFPESQWEEKSAEYAGQLLAYQEAVEAQGIEVAGMWVHLPLCGGVVEVRERVPT